MPPLRSKSAAPPTRAAPADVDTRVREFARALGFDAVGVARADVPIEVDHARYEAFLEAGLHGEMAWLADHREVRARLDGDAILPGARSVICLARRYQRSPAQEAEDPPLARGLARYARGRDYHNGLRKKLRQLAAFLRRLGDEAAEAHPDRDPARVRVEARPLCDSAPVLERAWAARAGLGFVGKNGLLIVPGQGSFVLLGEVVTTLALTPDSPLAERCGACTRCLDACPTDAFVKPFVLDARRCIAYLTIEHRSAIAPALREAIGEHLFGCDDCQTVCPFNASARPRDEASTAPFAPHERWSVLPIERFLALDEESWKGLAEGSPLYRATVDGLARNAAIVLGNRRDPLALEALRAAAESHRSPVVREAAAWALGRLADEEQRPEAVREKRGECT